MWHFRPRLACLVVPALAALLGCEATHPPIPPPSGDRVVLIGLDAGTWTIIRPLLDKGDLPNIRSLVDRGWSGVLESMEPTFSPMLWTTIATGHKPSEHGITGFLAPTQSGEQVPVTSNLRHTETLWTIASRTGRTVNVIGWYVTWPTEAINGVMVADRIGPQREDGRLTGGTDSLTAQYPGVSPASYLPRAMSLIVYPEDFLSPLEQSLHKQFLIYPVDATRTAIAEDLFETHPADLTMIYLWGIDPTQHLFWKYHDPASWVGPPLSPGEKLRGDLVADYYRDTDVLLGRLLAYVRPNDTVMIVSDHGAGPVAKYDPKHGNSGDHRIEGIIIAAGPPIRHGTAATPPSVLDVTPTVLDLLGLPAGRDMSGSAITEMFTPAWRSAHPEQRIATWEPKNRHVDRWPISTKSDEHIKDKLRRLGYIE